MSRDTSLFEGAVQFCRSPNPRVPARAIRSRGCQCALYFCIRRSPCLRTGPSYHQSAARAILEGFSCTHDSAGARMLIGTRNACTFAPSVAPSARMTFLHDRLVRSGQRGAGNILELLQMPRQYSTRIFSCMLAPFVAPSARMTLLQIDLMRADNMLRATWRWNYRCHGNTPLAYTQRICRERVRVRACCLVSVHACVLSERASGRVRVCVMGAPVAVADAHQALAVAAMMCTMTRTCPALVIAFDLQVLIARACARGDGCCTCRNVRRSGSSPCRLD